MNIEKWISIAKKFERGFIHFCVALVIVYHSNNFRFCAGWLEKLIPLYAIRKIMICCIIFLIVVIIIRIFAWALSNWGNRNC